MNFLCEKLWIFVSKSMDCYTRYAIYILSVGVAIKGKVRRGVGCFAPFAGAYFLS